MFRKARRWTRVNHETKHMHASETVQVVRYYASSVPVLKPRFGIPAHFHSFTCQLFYHSPSIPISLRLSSIRRSIFYQRSTSFFSLVAIRMTFTSLNFVSRSFALQTSTVERLYLRKPHVPWFMSNRMTIVASEVTRVPRLTIQSFLASWISRDLPCH